jgi:HSP20 family molecular chaperone IbpA
MNLDKVGMGLNTVTLLQEKPAIKNIERIFPLGSNVLTEKLTAKLIDGILTIKLPKVKVGYGSTQRVAVATA